MSILEKLYYGNIRPHTKGYPQTPEYLEAAGLMQRNMDNLLKTLNEEEKETLEKYCDARDDSERIGRYDLFMYTVRLCVMLMAEVFTDEEMVIDE